MSKTADHRIAPVARSGDTHLIGPEDDAVAVNLDQQARDEAAAATAKSEARAARSPRSSQPD